MCPDGFVEFIGLDMSLDNACLVARAPRMYEALREIAEGKGVYSTDRLTHAENTIRDATRLAQDELDEITQLAQTGRGPSKTYQRAADDLARLSRDKGRADAVAHRNPVTGKVAVRPQAEPLAGRPMEAVLRGRNVKLRAFMRQARARPRRLPGRGLRRISYLGYLIGYLDGFSASQEGQPRESAHSHT